jgi:hypothetical protein
MVNDSVFKSWGYLPGAKKLKCFCCGRKYFAEENSINCKPCAEKMKTEFDALFPPEQQQRLMDAENYLSGITINRTLNF